MSKTKTLNARASHFSADPSPPYRPPPPTLPLSERLGSATVLFGKILCCQRKSNLVNLDLNTNAGNRRCSL